MTRLDFHFHSAHSRARHAAENLPFTEHCHGETVTTEPVETKRHLVLKVVALVGVVGVLWMIGDVMVADAARHAAEARV